MKHLARITATLAISAVAAAVTTTAASAQEQRWQSQAYNDANNGGRYTAYLTLGIPETDDRQFQATCSHRGQVAVLGYNTGNLRNGRQVIVDFFKKGRHIYAASGNVYHGDGNEGVAGVLFRPGVNDGLWTTLETHRGRISYRIRGLRRAFLPLRRAGAAIGRYLRDCRSIQEASNGGGVDHDNEENNVASARSCGAFGNIKSINSGRPMTIRFVNRSGSHRSVMWLDYQGQPKHYKELAPGQSYSQQTFAGHPWMFTDGPGNCKEVFVPRAGGQTTFAITFRR